MTIKSFELTRHYLWFLSPPPTLLLPHRPKRPALSWTASSGTTSYNIYRDGTNIGSSTTNSYTDTTAAPGDHTYYVTAINSAGESGPSNSVDVQVVTAPAITSSATASTSMRQPFTFTVMTTGSPTPAITETGTLPSGITFQDNGDGTATLSGQAASGSSGSYPLTFTANNGVGSAATQNFTAYRHQRQLGPGHYQQCERHRKLWPAVQFHRDYDWLSGPRLEQNWHTTKRHHFY